MQKDKYGSFVELQAGEQPSAYCIVTVHRGSAVAVMAPHGGAIEPGTSEIARAIAGAELSLYLFEGRKAEHSREDLHITSTNFDEPQARHLVAQSQVVLAVHGEASEAEAIVYLGGRDAALGGTVRGHLEAAGFDVSSTPSHRCKAWTQPTSAIGPRPAPACSWSRRKHCAWIASRRSPRRAKSPSQAIP